MQYEEDLLNAAFSIGYEPDDNISRKQLLHDAEQWIINLAR